MNIPRQDYPSPMGVSIRHKSPVLAGFLSLFPGLGQIYIGAYRRGFIHAGIFAAFVFVLSAEGDDSFKPPFGIMMAFFLMYNLIDAVRMAHLFNATADGISVDDLRRDFMAGVGQRGSIGGGLALLAGGLLFLLHTCFGMPLDWLQQWWPILPIGFGAWLLWAGIRDRRQPRETARS